MSAKQAPRILITRLSHIGDCVLTTPVANAIKETYPDASISWAVESPSHQLLENHPAIDSIVKIPKGWLKSPRKILQLRSQLRERRFDASIDPQGLTKSSMLGWLSGARMRIGLAKPWSGELAPWTYTHSLSPESTHIVVRTLELLSFLGIESPTAQFHMPIDADSIISADEMIARAHLGGGFVVINPGASWPSKCWESERFGRVAKALGEQFSVTSLVVWAGDSEKELAECVVNHSGGHAIVAEQTSLRELMALCKRTRLFVSADTGPLHMAASVGTPCVGLYGPTKPSHCGAFGDRSINLQAWYQDGSRKARRRAKNLAMRDIDVHCVVDACRLQLCDSATPDETTTLPIERAA